MRNFSPPSQREVNASLSKTFPQQLTALKQQADQLLSQISYIKKPGWPQRYYRFLICIMTNYNHSFVSQYTILYKSYMIVVAFVLTMVSNLLWMGYGERRGEAGGVEREWVESVALVLPLKGKFSIVFFQLMFVTSVQIVYETVIELHYRFNKRRFSKSHSFIPATSIHAKTSPVSTNQKPTTSPSKSANHHKLHQQSPSKRQPDNELAFLHYNSKNIITTPSLEYWESSEILGCLLEIFHDLKCTQMKIYESKLPESFRKKDFTYRPLLSSTKFLYLFSLLYLENVLWEGIIIKQWKSRFVHLVIIASCVAEFVIWNVINVVMERGQNVTFGGKSFVQIGKNGDISLGIY